MPRSFSAAVPALAFPSRFFFIPVHVESAALQYGSREAREGQIYTDNGGAVPTPSSQPTFSPFPCDPQ